VGDTASYTTSVLRVAWANLRRPARVFQRAWVRWVALGLIVRLAVWAFVPASRFASDEASYFGAASLLLTEGRQDLFWPPLTGWLIALARWALGIDSVPIVRLAWIAMDGVCLVLVGALAWRVGEAVSAGQSSRASLVASLATLAYALYLPAISHAQFLTSEIPALLQMLAILVLLARASAGVGAYGMAGLLSGTLTLTRPNLLPLVVLLPIAARSREQGAATSTPTHWGTRDATPPGLDTPGGGPGVGGPGWRRPMAFVLAGGLVVSAAVVRNAAVAGEVTIAANSAYNLYLGNRDLYSEDLDLFNPRATPAQIEFRRQMWAGTLQYPTESAAKLQRMALTWIADHPVLFLRRALGRLARVFAPKTDVLELVGGEQAAGVFSPAGMGLLLAANLEWTIVLAAGIPGLVLLRRANRHAGRLLCAAVVGSLLLCLVAIAKPRYSFVFDPLLIIGAVVLVVAPERGSLLTGRSRWLVLGIWLFLLWGWIAWLIFALSSRSVL
jgi:hypothetical protein